MKPIIVRGGGDLATGTIHRLCQSGYPVIILEDTKPSAIRQKVSFCQAVYEGTMEVEGIVCTKVDSFQEAMEKVRWNRPMLLTDPSGECLKQYHPDILIDGILAKKNLGTRRDMADLTIGLGPGFTAGEDVDYVIETKRGHYLGRKIEKGQCHTKYRSAGPYRRIWKGTGDACALCGCFPKGERNRRLGGSRTAYRIYSAGKGKYWSVHTDFRRGTGNFTGWI